MLGFFKRPKASLSQRTEPEKGVKGMSKLRTLLPYIAGFASVILAIIEFKKHKTIPPKKAMRANCASAFAVE